MSRKTFNEILPVPLTNHEVLERADHLTDLMRKKAELEEEKKRQAASLKSQIDDADAQGRKIAKAIRDRSEDRPVECTNVFRLAEDKKSGSVETIRLDTGKVVGARAMTKEEVNDLLQMSLFDREEAEAFDVKESLRAIKEGVDAHMFAGDDDDDGGAQE